MLHMREPWLETDLVHKYSRHASSCFVLALCFRGEGGKGGGREGGTGKGKGKEKGDRDFPWKSFGNEMGGYCLWYTIYFRKMRLLLTGCAAQRRSHGSPGGRGIDPDPRV